jgi:hypothetical protein
MYITQRQYAAADAFATCEVFLKLVELYKEQVDHRVGRV